MTADPSTPPNRRWSTATLSAAGIDREIAAQWDALAAGRGSQGDFFDTHVWFGSWAAGAGPAALSRIRIPAVRHGERLAALLPLTVHGRTGITVGRTNRQRSRILAAGAEPDQETLRHLAEAVGRSGVRHLALRRLPARDPATEGLLQALRADGWATATQRRSIDMLAPVPAGGWDAYRDSLHGFERYARRFDNRLSAAWDVELETYGRPVGKPVEEVLDIYAALQAASWRGAFSAELLRERTQFLKLAERRGWARVYLLRVAGLPVAVQVWLRVGESAVWRSTAYDQRLAVLGAGTVLQWRAQQEIFAEQPPALVDLMPGTTPEKDRLVLAKVPLLDVEAQRRTPLTPVSLPVRTLGSRAEKVARDRTRLLSRRVRRRLGGAGRGPAEPEEAPATERVHPSGTDPLEVAPLDSTPVIRRYLALCAGLPAPAAAERTWEEGDTWWRINSRREQPNPAPTALARMAPDGRTVRELLHIPPHPEGPAEEPATSPALAAAPQQLLAALAESTGHPVQAPPPAAVLTARLPWPNSA